MTVEQLWVRVRPALERYLREQRKLTRADAQDAVDEAFAEMMRRDCPATERNLWRLALDAAYEIGLRHRREYETVEAQAVLSGVAIPGIETAIFRADFDRAVRQLPEDERSAFALTELRGLTVREAAGVLGESRSTIQRRCEAARTYLREELA